jgi:hypothetical protein
MIIEKEKILWKPKNAGIACGGSAFTGIYARGVNNQIFSFIKDGRYLDITFLMCYVLPINDILFGRNYR